jgi:RimJ/RimL family protein N-acetyltransferase
MFYLKYVLLEMTQAGQGKAKNIGVEGLAWKRQEPWKSWISSLEEVGIQVLLMDETKKGFPNGGMEEGRKDQSEQAVLWITDDAKCAKAYAQKGLPVMGVLRENNSGPQSFDGVPFLVSDLTEVEPEYLEKVYRRQAGIPWEIARTKRCVIRETIPQDAKAFYEIYQDPAVTEFMEDLPKDADAFEAWLEDYTKHVYSLMEYGIWTVCLKRKEERENVFQMQDKGAARGDIEQPEQEQMMVIGRAGLTVREGHDAPELGFVIGEPWRGQGYAIEICEAILEYAREQELPEVIAFAEDRNIASVGLLRRLGFREIGEAFLDGKTCRMFQKSLL